VCTWRRILTGIHIGTYVDRDLYFLVLPAGRAGSEDILMAPSILTLASKYYSPFKGTQEMVDSRAGVGIISDGTGISGCTIK
jgi:hypothetical protein